MDKAIYHLSSKCGNCDFALVRTKRKYAFMMKSLHVVIRFFHVPLAARYTCKTTRKAKAKARTRTLLVRPLRLPLYPTQPAKLTNSSIPFHSSLSRLNHSRISTVLNPKSNGRYSNFPQRSACWLHQPIRAQLSAFLSVTNYSFPNRAPKLTNPSIPHYNPPKLF